MFVIIREREIPAVMAVRRGCLPYGRRTGHGHEKASVEQVQGGVREGVQKTEGGDPRPSCRRRDGKVHRPQTAVYFDAPIHCQGFRRVGLVGSGW